MSAHKPRRNTLGPEQAQLYSLLLEMGKSLRTIRPAALTDEETFRPLLSSEEVIQRAGPEALVADRARHASQAITDFARELKDRKDKLAFEAALGIGEFEGLSVAARLELLGSKRNGILRDTFRRRREQTFIAFIDWLMHLPNGSNLPNTVSVGQRAQEDNRGRWELSALFHDAVKLSYSIATCLTVRYLRSNLGTQITDTDEKPSRIDNLFGVAYLNVLVSHRYCLVAGDQSGLSRLSRKLPSDLLDELVRLNAELVDKGPLDTSDVEILMKHQIGDTSLMYREKEGKKVSSLIIASRHWSCRAALPWASSYSHQMNEAANIIFQVSSLLYSHLGRHPSQADELAGAGRALEPFLANVESARLAPLVGSYPLDSPLFPLKHPLLTPAVHLIVDRCDEISGGLTDDDGRSIWRPVDFVI